MRQYRLRTIGKTASRPRMETGVAGVSGGGGCDGRGSESPHRRLCCPPDEYGSAPEGYRGYGMLA